MVRPTSVDRYGMKKGAWSEEEDNKLRDYIQRYSHWNWRLLPKYAGLARCGKSCRLRWVNYLKPGIKRGNFTQHEEELIIELQSQLGNKWSAIAAKLPGRTDNEIKNFWQSHTKKCKKRSIPSTNVKTSIITNDQNDQLGYMNIALNNTLSFEAEISNLEVYDTNSSYSIDDPQVLDFWTDSFPEGKICSQNDYFPPLSVPEENFFDYPELYNNELSSSNSSYMTGLNWNITDDDNSIISSDSVSLQIKENIWSQSLVANTSNAQSEIDFILPQEAGDRFYDHSLLYFDDSIFNLY